MDVQVTHNAAAQRFEAVIDGRLAECSYHRQGGMNPPLVVIHGNSLDHISDGYKRFLEGRLREHFKLSGTPIRIEMRSAANPFDDNG